jgi:hypothetical protein
MKVLQIGRIKGHRSPKTGLIAMQKVESSNPFSCFFAIPLHIGAYGGSLELCGLIGEAAGAAAFDRQPARFGEGGLGERSAAFRAASPGADVAVAPGYKAAAQAGGEGPVHGSSLLGPERP